MEWNFVKGSVSIRWILFLMDVCEGALDTPQILAD